MIQKAVICGAKFLFDSNSKRMLTAEDLIDYKDDYNYLTFLLAAIDYNERQ